MTTGKQLFSTLADGKLTVEITESEFAAPTGNQILVKMEAAPINSMISSHWRYQCNNTAFNHSLLPLKNAILPPAMITLKISYG